MCITTFGPSSRPYNFFAMLLIHSAFCYVFFVAIFLSKIVRLLLHLVVGMFSCPLSQLLVEFPFVAL